MSLLNKLFPNLFGSKEQNNKPTEAPSDHHLNWWEKENSEKAKAIEVNLKDWIVASVKEKGGLPFTWESGNDEAFVTFKDSNEAEEDRYVDLEEYITRKLDIPDAGEFEMTGSGMVYIDGNLVRAKYSSTMKAVIDYDEEAEQEVYGEAEEDSGDKVLFTI